MSACSASDRPASPTAPIEGVPRVGARHHRRARRSLAVVQTRKGRSLLRMVITFHSSTGPSPVTAMQDRT